MIEKVEKNHEIEKPGNDGSKGGIEVLFKVIEIILEWIKT